MNEGTQPFDAVVLSPGTGMGSENAVKHRSHEDMSNMEFYDFARITKIMILHK